MADNIESVDARLLASLQTHGVPVARLFYGGDAPTYMTFQIVVGAGTNHMDDEYTAREYLYRVDIYSRSDYIGLVRRVELALRDVGFYGFTIDPETYEPATQLYHIPIGVRYTEQIEIGEE